LPDAEITIKDPRGREEHAEVVMRAARKVKKSSVIRRKIPSGGANRR